MDTGLGRVPGQDGHHAGRGAEASGVHTDATLLVPEDAHHHLGRDAPCGGGHAEGPLGWKGDLWPWVKAVGEERGWHRSGPPGPQPAAIPSLTLVLPQQLPPGLEAGFGSLHAHRLLGEGEDLREVESALPTPPALCPGVGPQLRVFGRDVRANAQLVGDVAGALCRGGGGDGSQITKRLLCARCREHGGAETSPALVGREMAINGNMQLW